MFRLAAYWNTWLVQNPMSHDQIVLWRWACSHVCIYSYFYSWFIWRRFINCLIYVGSSGRMVYEQWIERCRVKRLLSILRHCLVAILEVLNKITKTSLRIASLRTENWTRYLTDAEQDTNFSTLTFCMYVTALTWNQCFIILFSRVACH
jgi:hypothetical protein